AARDSTRMRSPEARSASSRPAALDRACGRRLRWVTSTKTWRRPVNGFSARYAESASRCKSAIYLSSRIATNATKIEPRRSIAMLKFTENHEWLRIEGDVATVGITDHAQEQLGDLVFVELPAPGARPEKGAAAAVVESVKAASDVYAPVSGEVIEIN